MRGIWEFGHGWHRYVASMEHFVDEHFRDTASGILGIVITFCVDHQTLKHSPYFFFDFRLQLSKFARFDELGDIVIGVKTRFTREQTFANTLGSGDADRLVSDARIIRHA